MRTGVRSATVGLASWRSMPATTAGGNVAAERRSNRALPACSETWYLDEYHARDGYNRPTAHIVAEMYVGAYADVNEEFSAMYMRGEK